MLVTLSARPPMTVARPLPRADLPDGALVAQILAGEADRFEVLMRRHNQRLFRTARAILRDDAEAEEAVQQAYVAAYQHLDSFRGDAQLATWLVRIVVNTALARRRALARHGDLALVREAELPEAPRPASPEEAASRGELRHLIEAAVDRLPEAYRVVFILRDVEELSTAETAAALDLGEEAVRVGLHRARRALRDLLLEGLDAEAARVFSFDGERCDRIVAGVFARLGLDPSRG
jgi:RNA polymerase sigma-70 factor (ECF subfamily)